MNEISLFILVLYIVSLLALSLLSTIKGVFLYAQREYLKLESELLRFIAGKILRLSQQKIQVSSTISFAKTFFTAVNILSCFFIIYPLKEHQLHTALLTMGISIVLLPIGTYSIPKIVSQTSQARYMVPAYFFYRIINILFLPFTALMFLSTLVISKFRGDSGYFDFLSEEEQRILDDAGIQEDGLDDTEKQMIHNIFNFDKTSVREIMLPRIDIEGVEINTLPQKALESISEMGHSRIPVYTENIDRIVGILYVKDIMAWISKHPSNPWSIKDLMRPAHFVPINKELADLMADMKAQRSHMVVVVDEYGGTAGLVTMEDILEEIVGEIHDEHDEHHEPLQKIGDTTYIADPHIELDDLCERLHYNFDYKNDKYNTLGGLVYYELGDVPKQHTTFRYQALTIEITKMDKQRIEEIQLELGQESSDTSGE
ncbi:hemolysin family protein [Chitinivibrio alkaliphilus]|uniref:CBS domain-containing protein n=1 Tax=Chitinivibrio alkaliphilus ACht1 TaxID=1313304 RepID=U7DDB5_9BACT|nr:hemolysin family protein [Chitinivibrio alkaliphilus]ERP38876.1 CBS domain-containing protein [Chitinivibrio alkaliphilus ACht1]